MSDWLKSGRSVFEPKKKVRWTTKARFGFIKHKHKGKKGKATFTPDGGVSKKEQRILVKASKPTKAYAKNPGKQAMRELRELNED